MRRVLTGLALALLTATSALAGSQTVGRRTQDVVVTAAVPPPAATLVTIGGYATFASNASSDVYHTPANGVSFTLQLLKARSGPSNGVEVSIFYDMNGDLSVLQRLDTIFVPNVGGTYDSPQIFSFIGNGTRRVVLRVINSSSQATVYRELQGYAL